MFEDSTFESTGRIRARSRGWMFAALAINGSILLTLVLVPLFYPEALPRVAMAMLMEAPATPPEQPRPVVRPVNATVVETQMPRGFIEAPSVIPHGYRIATGPEVAVDPGWLAMGPDGGAGSGDDPFAGRSVHPDVRPAVKQAAHVSSGVMQGMLISKLIPRYPPIAVSARASGTVVLQATISRGGTIENLRVVSGPALLQQAALDAVKQWRYRPYLLNGDPVEVETTVNVEITLN